MRATGTLIRRLLDRINGRRVGILWGVALGLLFDSFMLVAATAWLAWAFLPLLVPILIGALAGALAIRRPGRPARTHREWVAAGGLVLVVWPACALGPIAARWAQLRLEAEAIPLCPGGTRGGVKITVLAFDSMPGYAFDIYCAGDLAQAIEFLRDELPRRGWDPQPPRTDTLGYSFYPFTRPRRWLAITPFEGWQGGAFVKELRVGCAALNLTYR